MKKPQLQIMPPVAGYYPVDDMPEYVQKINQLIKPKPRKLRTDLKSGMICIITDGQFIGKRVFYIGNKTNKKEMAVCLGPASINNVRMFSIDERFLFTTSQILEIPSFKPNEINNISDCDMSYIEITNQGFEITELEKKIETSLLQQISKIKHLKSYLQENFTIPEGDPLSLDY
ncbi:60s ribosomal protein L6 [Pseudoloma neurophilia]|uniref:60s ribosomal protein L6 n=1 Tax=Pseudoloma neurophilia TaxID=146866 RepID=A0A0R0LY85_9MICR|nr:60s ribosomal protein L6 [Pseudoloma neurophilia]